MLLNLVLLKKNTTRLENIVEVKDNILKMSKKLIDENCSIIKHMREQF